MANEVELETLVIRLKGDMSEAEQMFEDAKAATRAYSNAAVRDISKIMESIENERVAREHMVAIQKSINDAEKQQKIAATLALRDVGNEMGKVEAKSRSLGTAFTDLGSTIMNTFAAGGIIGWINNARKAFEDFELSTNRLKAAIEVNGSEVETTFSRYNEFAKTMGAVTTTTKGATLEMLKQAEARGLTGEKAEEAVTQAIALAAATDGSAKAILRATILAAEGTPQRLQMLLGMRGIKTEMEKSERAAKLLASGMKLMEVEGGTNTAAMNRLKATFVELQRDVGQVLSESMKPMIEILQLLAKEFKALDPETKAVLVQIGVLGAAFLGLRPTLAVLSYVFAPLTAVLGMIPVLIGAIFTPMGAFVALITTATAAVVYFGEYGGSILEWFGGRWDALKEHFAPAIQGMKDAIKAGNLKLAFDILWAQVKLSFAQGIQPLREMWSALVLFFKTDLMKMGDNLVQLYDQSVAGLKLLGYDVAKFLSSSASARGEFEDEQQAIIDATRKKHKLMEEARKAENEQALNDFKKSIDDISAEIKKLEEARDKKVTQAKDEAAKVVAAPKIKMPKIPEFPTKELKVNVKFNAAAFDSAEAQGRIQEFYDRLTFGATDKSKAAGRFSSSEAGSAEAEGRVRAQEEQQASATKQLEELKQVNKKLQKQIDDNARKPAPIEIKPSDAF